MWRAVTSQPATPCKSVTLNRQAKSLRSRRFFATLRMASPAYPAASTRRFAYTTLDASSLKDGEGSGEVSRYQNAEGPVIPDCRLTNC